MQLRKFTAHEAVFSALTLMKQVSSWSPAAMIIQPCSGISVQEMVIRAFEGHKGTVSSVDIDSTGELLVTGSHDGTLKTWDIRTGELLLTYIFMGENDWMVSTPDGHFDASEGARKSISFARGTELFSIDQFFDEFYSPGLLQEKLKSRYPDSGAGSTTGDSRSPGNGSSFSVESTTGQSPFPGGSIQERLKEFPPPGVEISSPGNQDTISAPRVSLNVNFTNKGGGISEVRILNNGKRIPFSNEEFKKVKKEGKSIEQTMEINLVPGHNTIQVSAYSDGRIESFPSVVRLFYDGKGQVINCYLVAVGINEYENPALNLNYAKNDARAFSKTMREQGKNIFQNIEVRSLYDKEATRENILQALDELAAKVRPEDVFVFYYAGHGSMVDNIFYFIPTENVSLYQAERLAEESLEAEAMQQKFRAIAALKQVVVLDACQSGGSAQILAQRGAMEEKAMAQLSRSSGVHVMAAAGSEQYATEVESLGHGLFTYTLLEALGGGADGAPRDGNVTVYELKAYLNDQVPELSREHKGSTQWPYTFSIGHDFPLIQTQKPPVHNE